jgi:hypothetical protein
LKVAANDGDAVVGDTAVEQALDALLDFDFFFENGRDALFGGLGEGIHEKGSCESFDPKG